MRVFFAIELPEPLRARLADLVQSLRPRVRGARWVPAANVHLTLRFLGEAEHAAVARLCERAARALAGCEPFDLRVAGLGVFPDPRRPRTLWVGVPSPPEALFRAHSVLEEAVRAEGFAPETRTFSPHFTIARFREPNRGLASLLGSVLGGSPLGELSVTELSCIESRLSPEGASYRTIAALPLGLEGPGQA